MTYLLLLGAPTMVVNSGEARNFVWLLLHNTASLKSASGYNSASNGKAETSVKACKNIAFSLLYMSGLPCNDWCFALLHGMFLLNLSESESSKDSGDDLK